MDERRAPGVAYDLRAEHDVPELPGQAVGNRLAPVDGKGKRIRLLVDAEVLALQRADFLGRDELEAELAVVDPFGMQHSADQLRRGGGVELGARTVRNLDLDHRPYFRRAVPVSSACSLYASTIRWTSLWRTTSSCPKRTNAMPSIEPRMSCTWMRPDACSRGRSTCVTSPVTTTFEPKPSRVRNICICSGVVFCASSRMMNESLSVLPRMNASGATSTVPRSMYVFSRSASSMS